MANVPTQHTSEDQLNQFNIAMRSQPWFIQWHQQRGLNPSGNGNRKLEGREQDDLERLVSHHYFGGQTPDGMTIDSGGSLNQKGGWAGMPTWAKVAIIAGATVATAGAAGAFSGAAAPGAIASGGSSTAAAGGTGATLTSLTGAPIIAANAAPVAAGVTGATVPTVAGGGAFTTMANFLKNPATRTALTDVDRMVSGAGDAAAANRGTQIEAQLAHDQLKLTAEREARSRQSDAYRKAMLGQLAVGYQPSARPAGAEGRHSQGFITPEAREAGALLYSQGMDQLKRGDTPSLTPFDQLATQPGRFERFSSYAGPALSMFDLLAEARKR